jgi:hypothetical protein
METVLLIRISVEDAADITRHYIKHVVISYKHLSVEIVCGM